MCTQEPPISFPLTHFSPWVARSARAPRANNPCERWERFLLTRRGGPLCVCIIVYCFQIKECMAWNRES